MVWHMQGRRPTRANFLLLAGIMLLLAGQRAMFHDYWLAGASLAVACLLIVVHFIRVRRFKRFDTAQHFD
jgi:Flp pilus assembly protein TadB